MIEPASGAASSSADGPVAQTVLEAARSFDFDRYLSALLAPSHARSDLITLAAYLGDVRRVPLMTQDATIGEIRLQWWRDTLSASGSATGNPVADAMAELARRRTIPTDLVLAPIEGASRTLYEDGIRDARELDIYADETEGAAIRLALSILGVRSGADTRAVEDAAGRAIALTRLALTLPQHLAQGRLPVPADRVRDRRDPRVCGPDEARSSAQALIFGLADDANCALDEFSRAQGRLSKTGFAALLPVALVAPYLRAVRKPGRDVLAEVADISPLSRVVRLWFAHRRGRV